MKYLLLLIGLVALQFTTSYCCWDSKDDDDGPPNPQYIFLREDEILDAIIMYEKESFWIYKEKTSGRLDTVTLLNYKEEQKIETGNEYGIVYTKKIAAMHSSLTDENYDIGIVKPIPDEVIPHHRPMLFKGKAAEGSDNDTMEDIIYCKWNVPRSETINLDLINQGQLIIEPHIELVVNGAQLDKVYQISHKKINGEVNTYYFDGGRGLIMYEKYNGEVWELINYSLVRIIN